MTSSIARLLLLLFVVPVATAAQDQHPEIAPPPRPSENFIHMTEAEVIAQLPARERQMVQQQTAPRDRFDVLLDVSDLRLADVGAKLDAGAPSVAQELLLYEAVVRVADEILRKPATGIVPRDKRFKKFERRLGRQLTLLKALTPELRPDDATTGSAVIATVTRIRNTALESALDSDMLTEP